MRARGKIRKTFFNTGKILGNSTPYILGVFLSLFFFIRYSLLCIQFTFNIFPVFLCMQRSWTQCYPERANKSARYQPGVRIDFGETLSSWRKCSEDLSMLCKDKRTFSISWMSTLVKESFLLCSASYTIEATNHNITL